MLPRAAKAAGYSGMPVGWGKGHARRRQRVVDASLKRRVPAIEIRLQLRGRAEIGTRGHDAENAGHSRHTLKVSGMRQLPGAADDAEHLLGREIEDRQPVGDLAADDAHAVVAAPGDFPGPCGALVGADAHCVHDASAEPRMGLEIAAQFAFDGAGLEIRRTPPSRIRGHIRRSSTRSRRLLPEATGARISGTSFGRVASIWSTVPGHSTSPRGA